MSTRRDKNNDGDLLTQEREQTRRPPMFKVILHNDDYTTQEWVVMILRQHFHKSQPEAYRLMLTVHTSGEAIVGVFSRDIAETKVAKVTRASREAGFPLLCTCEPE